MPRSKPRGKTATIKQRTVYTYLPSEKAVAAWQKEAERRGLSLSHFVFECVEAAIEPAKGKPIVNPADLAEKIHDLEDRLARATAELKIRDAALEKLEADLRRYRLEALKPAKATALRKYDRKVIDAIRSRGEISSLELMAALRIDSKDTEMVEAVRNQLEGLEKWRVIEPTATGWRWVDARR